MSEGKRLIWCKADQSPAGVALATRIGHRAAMTLEDHIIFIDGEAIVIDKPAGLPVDRPRTGGPSVDGRLGELMLGFQRPPAPMHRLDQDTSGCLLLARNPKARKLFQAAFEAGLVEKVYIAVLGGEIAGEAGEIDLPLMKISSEAAGWRMVGAANGKPATTAWRTLAVRDGKTLVEFRPRTGRTHQIRVHAREGLGVGIVGDRVYGFPGGEMLLHASRLIVPRGAKPPIDVTAPLPERFGDWREFETGDGA
jgi:tRNA pseudouridine32 synthase/23S rRNA pseudouridine746 synthase